VYQVGINKGIILPCTAYQISRHSTMFVIMHVIEQFIMITEVWEMVLCVVCRNVVLKEGLTNIWRCAEENIRR